LAKEGAAVMLNGFGDAAAIETLRAGLAAEFGVKVGYNGADLSKAEGVAGLVKATQVELGGLDILVNNAGIQYVSPVDEFPDAKWEQVIALNLSAVFYGMKAAIPGMKAKGWGRIINIASAHGLVASANKVAYVAAKHGVVGATKVAALELANAGVTVNAICPGWVLTPLVEKQIADRAAANGTTVREEEVKLLSEKQPMHKFSTPEHLGALAVFLSSDAAETMTGVVHSMDGGWIAQ
jgi:3-hydroxybutyrate dehydrogenase